MITEHDPSEKDWLEDEFSNPRFLCAVAKEDFIEGFLAAVEELMRQQDMSRRELAARLGCSPANVTQILRRSRNLTTETMVEIAFHLGRRMDCTLSPLRESTDVLEVGDPSRFLSEYRTIGESRSMAGHRGRFEFAAKQRQESSNAKQEEDWRKAPPEGYDRAA